MNDSRPGMRRLGLGALLPAITLLFLAGDLALRAVPLDGLAFRAWEVMTRHPEPGGAFAASRRLETDRAYGDLAMLANRPRMRKYRRETFTTDVRGFRNRPNLLAEGPPDVVLFGDSFAAGCGVSDDETLAAQLSRLTGRRVYDAAGLSVSAEVIRHTLSDLGMTRGVVVWEALEPRGEATHRPAARSLAFPPVQWLLQMSPIRAITEAGRKRIENDVILPNAFQDLAPALDLQNGTTMLFLAEEIDPAVPEALEEGSVRHIGSTARAIASPDLRVVVLLVPHKYTVYGPLATRNSGLGVAFGRPLAAIERGLRDVGVEVLNVTRSLSLAAQEGLAAGRLVYHIDDSHWNPEGIHVAARELAAVLDGSR